MYIIAYLIVSLFGLNSFHDYHTSLTEITYNPKNKSLEVSMRLFTDDLELALTKLNGGKIITLESQAQVVEPLLELYIKKNFAIVSANKEVKKINYYGKDKESEATWVYIEILDCAQIKDFKLFNSLLVDLFSDQNNLVNIIYPSEKKTLVFDNKTRMISWPF